MSNKLNLVAAYAANLVWIFSLASCAYACTDVRPSSQLPLPLPPLAQRLEAIDDYLESYFIPTNGVVGLGLSIVINGSVVMSKGYGRRNIEPGADIPVDADTLFLIASVSKSFTATLAVKTLYEKFGSEYGDDGSVLDVPIVQLVPTYDFVLGDRYRTQRTTFRDLLAHRTCLQSTDLDLVIGTMPTRAEYMYRTRYQQEVCPFRSRDEYNNAFYTLAGEIVAHIKRTTYEALLLNLFRQLGMMSSTHIDPGSNYTQNPNMANGYFRKGSDELYQYDMELLRQVANAVAAAGVLSSPNDMTKWMQFHLRRGRAEDGAQVVPEKVMSWMYSISHGFDFEGGKQFESDQSPVNGLYGYGLAFFLNFYDGFKRVGHSGLWVPFNSYMSLVPAMDIGIFTSSNGPGQIGANTGVRHEVAHIAMLNILRGKDASRNMVDKAKRNMNLEPDMGRLARKALERRTNRDNSSATGHSRPLPRSGVNTVDMTSIPGTYGEALVGDIHIILDPETNELTTRFGQWGSGTLHPVLDPDSPSLFYVNWTTTIAQFFYAYGYEPVWEPVMYVDFIGGDPNILLVYLDDELIAPPFVQNATVETLPQRPYKPGSC